jgi:DNA-binding NtrC family response regulator
VLLVDDDDTFPLTIGVRLKSMGTPCVRQKMLSTPYPSCARTIPDVVCTGRVVAGRRWILGGRSTSESHASATTPIIFVTASEKAELRERAMKLGAAEFLQKPFDAVRLAGAIEIGSVAGR